MIGKYFPWPIPEELYEEYDAAAAWCNANGAYMADTEDGGLVVAFVPPPSEEELFSDLRANRDHRLNKTDYLMQPDYPIDSDLLEKVKAYRQYLRDLPSLEGAPWDGGGPETPWPVNPLEA